MRNKKKSFSGGLVYSTYLPSLEDSSQQRDEPAETLDPKHQDLRISIDRKLKGGKSSTVIERFVGRSEDLEAFARKLKQTLSVGGSVKDGNIILQGDCRDRVCHLLDSWGYRYKKAGG